MANNEKDLFRTLTTPGELAEALKQFFVNKEPELDIKKLKYVMYTRKSTTGDEKQERSIEDQIADCVQMQIKKNELNVVDTIREKESAKAPGIRPKFKQMLKDIEDGKYNAVLAWHPDRLARNMKDAGEIIYLLEENIIKDLRFATFTFENSPMGKMLLGMSFVLSKQYSDHLRESVIRGQRRSTEAGLSIHTPKHGYCKGPDKHLRPDTYNDNWNLIKNAFKMRIAGKQYDEIMKYLNGNHYTRAPALKKNRNRHFRVVENTLTKIFRDPVYAGVLLYGREVCDLTEIYPFVPMISVQEYCKLNNYSFNGSAFIDKKHFGGVQRFKVNLLNGIVKCAACGSNMGPGITVKHEKKKVSRYYMFRCNNDKCSMKNKSVRSMVALKFVYEYFKKCDFTSKKMYEQLVKEKEDVLEDMRVRLDSKLRSLRQSKVERVKSYERTKQILIENDKKMMKHFTANLDETQQEIRELEEQIRFTKNQLDNINDAIPSYEKYFELFSNMVETLINTRNMELKDKIIRKYFLNLSLEAEKISERKDGKPVFRWSVSDYKLTPNYEKLLLISDGGPAEN